jgi:hypothetical protein
VVQGPTSSARGPSLTAMKSHFWVPWREADVSPIKE